MRLLHIMQYWFSGHCWGCWTGAKWRERQNPGQANPRFASRTFLLFGVLLVLIDATEMLTLWRAAGPHGALALTTGAATACGLITGVLHGREVYLPFW